VNQKIKVRDEPKKKKMRWSERREYYYYCVLGGSIFLPNIKKIHDFTTAQKRFCNFFDSFLSYSTFSG